MKRKKLFALLSSASTVLIIMLIATTGAFAGTTIPNNNAYPLTAFAAPPQDIGQTIAFRNPWEPTPAPTIFAATNTADGANLAIANAVIFDLTAVTGIATLDQMDVVANSAQDNSGVIYCFVVNGASASPPYSGQTISIA